MESKVQFQEVYDELRAIAGRILASENPGHTLQPTALVHEAYLKMQASYPELLRGKDRQQFFACAAESMRRILVDQSRKKKAVKRGRNWNKVPLEGAEIAVPRKEIDPEALSEALNALKEHHAHLEELVKLRYFVGLSRDQTAEILECSVSSLNRDWNYAKAWLKDYMDSHRNSEPA